MVGSNTLLEVNGKRVRGRLYPWGVVEGEDCYYSCRIVPMFTVCVCVCVSFAVENKDHCDFVKLRTMLIR